MDDDVALPRATLVKIIKESMPAQMRVSSELIDLLIECCTEFVHMVYSQANEVSTTEKRSTILPDHITQALEQLDFSEWVPEVRKTWEEHKSSSKSVTKTDKSGSVELSEEELCALQQKMLAEAASRSFPEGHPDDALQRTASGAGPDTHDEAMEQDDVE